MINKNLTSNQNHNSNNNDLKNKNNQDINSSTLLINDVPVS
jgi:hypothetical protein